MILIKLFIVCLQARTLAAAIFALWPKYLTPETAFQQAFVASIAATNELPAELLLAIARVESHFEPSDTSRMNGATGVRETSKWPSLQRGASFVAPYFCGVMQTRALTWRGCLAQRSIVVGYTTGVAELTRWLRYCRGSIRCALAGHGGGVRAAQRVGWEARAIDRWQGKRPYWHRVLIARDQLHRKLARAPRVE